MSSNSTFLYYPHNIFYSSFFSCSSIQLRFLYCFWLFYLLVSFNLEQLFAIPSVSVFSHCWRFWEARPIVLENDRSLHLALKSCGSGDRVSQEWLSYQSLSNYPECWYPNHLPEADANFLWKSSGFKLFQQRILKKQHLAHNKNSQANKETRHEWKPKKAIRH